MYSLAQACLAYGYNDLKQTFAGMDQVPPHYTVFDVGGNRSRSLRRFTTTGSRYSFVMY